MIGSPRLRNRNKKNHLNFTLLFKIKKVVYRQFNDDSVKLQKLLSLKNSNIKSLNISLSFPQKSIDQTVYFAVINTEYCQGSKNDLLYIRGKKGVTAKLYLLTSDLFLLIYFHFLLSGITCYDRLEEILKLVDSNVAKRESKYVIQKYIGKDIPVICFIFIFTVIKHLWNTIT